MNIGIVGLGLMGGSMAKGIKVKTGHTVFAIDINDESMLMARLSATPGSTPSEITHTVSWLSPNPPTRPSP